MLSGQASMVDMGNDRDVAQLFQRRLLHTKAPRIAKDQQVCFPSSTFLAHFCLLLKLPRTCPDALYFDIMNILDYIWSNAVFVPNNQDWTLSFECQWPRPPILNACSKSSLPGTWSGRQNCTGRRPHWSPNNNSITGRISMDVRKQLSQLSPCPAGILDSPCLCVNLHRPAYADTRCKDARMAQNLPITSPGSVRKLPYLSSFSKKKMHRLETLDPENLIYLFHCWHNSDLNSFLVLNVVPWFYFNFLPSSTSATSQWDEADGAFALTTAESSLFLFRAGLTQDTKALWLIWDSFYMHQMPLVASHRGHLWTPLTNVLESPKTFHCKQIQRSLKKQQKYTNSRYIISGTCAMSFPCRFCGDDKS